MASISHGITPTCMQFINSNPNLLNCAVNGLKETPLHLAALNGRLNLLKHLV